MVVQTTAQRKVLFAVAPPVKAFAFTVKGSLYGEVCLAAAGANLSVSRPSPWYQNTQAIRLAVCYGLLRLTLVIQHLLDAVVR